MHQAATRIAATPTGRTQAAADSSSPLYITRTAPRTATLTEPIRDRCHRNPAIARPRKPPARLNRGPMSRNTGAKSTIEQIGPANLNDKPLTASEVVKIKEAPAPTTIPIWKSGRVKRSRIVSKWVPTLGAASVECEASSSQPGIRKPVGQSDGSPITAIAAGDWTEAVELQTKIAEQIEWLERSCVRCGVIT